MPSARVRGGGASAGGATTCGGGCGAGCCAKVTIGRPPLGTWAIITGWSRSLAVVATACGAASRGAGAGSSARAIVADCGASAADGVITN
jgi:hypothetical protein